jgi:peptidyl-tRNA hydrolase, PTH1 family
VRRKSRKRKRKRKRRKRKKRKRRNNPAMKLVAGIGNPSAEYEQTRHNAGFMAVDRISAVSGISLTETKHKSCFGRGWYCGKELLLVKPLTFVNLSGRALRSFLKYYPLSTEDILIIHDDMDIPFGRIRIKNGGSSAGHKGVASVISEMGTDKFARIRIGIGSPERKDRGVGFVLGRFSREEKKIVEEVLDTCVDAVEEILAKGPEAAMNRFN